VKKKRQRHPTLIENLPKTWQVLKEEGDWFIVKMPKVDLYRLRMLKLPEEVREYFKLRQREYRQRLREKKSQSSRRGGVK
jgi:hypothetical protein